MAKITFTSNSRVLGYRPGQVITMDEKDLTGTLRALLARGRHLSLIDPLTLDEPEEVKSEEKPKANPVKAKAKDKSDGSGESSSNSEERGQASGEVNGHSASSGV